MRVLVATDQWFPDFTGGSARVAAETAKRLARRGHEVTVLAPQEDGQPGEERDGSLTVLRALKRSRLPQTLTDVVQTRRRARRLEGEFDVLLAHQPTTAVGLAWAGLETPLVSVFHASPALEARYLATRAPRTRAGLAARALVPLLRLLEGIALRRSTRVLVLSEFSRSLVAAASPAAEPKVRAVGGGVDVEDFTPLDGPEAARSRLGVEPEPPLLFTARRLEPRMGLDELLRALTLLDARLVLAGSGSLEDSLCLQAAELGLADRVRFVGRLADAELREWYRAADLVVVPTAAYEGFGLVVAEALASGTPVVGTPVGAIPELLRPLEEALVADAPDAASLARAIERALTQDGAELRRRSRDYACARFDWELVTTAWEQALLEPLAEHATQRRQRFELLGAPLDPVSLEEAVGIVEEAVGSQRPLRHASVNAPKIVQLRSDPELAAALRRCELVTADGQPVVWAARLLGRPLPERVAGIDLMEALLARAEAQGHPVFLLGAEPDVLQAAATEIRRRHPAIAIAGMRDGYFGAEEEDDVVAEIRATEAKLLFVALPTPRKELFVDRHSGELPVFAMGVGGAFDVLAGLRRRAPRWAQRAGLEWGFRLAQEPRRLAGRYVDAGVRFFLLLAEELVRTRLLRRAER